MSQIDILILSNGPGEVTTWVRPVVKALRLGLGKDRSQVRISVILSPCPHASGKEVDIAASYPEVDRVQGAEYFFSFLLRGTTEDNWDWRSKGVVIFLGGDQFFSIIIGKRLGYKTIVYAEWEARWHNLIDRFAVMKPEVAAKVSPKYAHKFTVVGDLIASAREEERDDNSAANRPELVGLLPGSKSAKLSQGVPLVLAIAEYIHALRPQTKFIIPVAPTLDLPTLVDFANPAKNPYVHTFKSSSAELLNSHTPVLKTATGLTIELITANPAYQILSQCSICLTTVGANTAELGSLGIPMIVLFPTQQLDAMRAWDGLPGLLANLPLVGSGFAKAINRLFIQRKGLLAWPNIWAQEEIVPELVGKLHPSELGEMVLDYLQNPDKLADMRNKLKSVRGESGAAQKISDLVFLP
ncbi:lipid-A-disaccharide synthase [Calothrix rhizosoleniae]|uniref:lipid-A-disaccharide synthase n=1 Tax=Calothrix rhizosoleniae TaxID=888997 RepID=UPI000B4997FC|nr:lipid-A-disaccharide synthase [Calothrix rhizosoleniae]